jgi:hypothetical protein
MERRRTNPERVQQNIKIEITKRWWKCRQQAANGKPPVAKNF